MADNEIKAADAAVIDVVPSEQPKATPDAQSERLAQLERKERAMWGKIKQLNAEKAEWEKAKATPQPKSISEERLKADVIGALAEAGFTHEQIAQKLLSYSPESLEIRSLRSELAAIKAETQKTQESFKQSQDQALQQAIKQLDREVKILVDGNEEYSAITASKDGRAAVVEYIKNTYQTDGILLTAEEAAKHVEDYLLDEALTFAKLPKIQSRLAASLTPVEPKTAPAPTKNIGTTITPAGGPKVAPTITHSMSPSASNLSAKDRRARAIAAFSNNLK